MPAAKDRETNITVGRSTMLGATNTRISYLLDPDDEILATLKANDSSTKDGNKAPQAQKESLGATFTPCIFSEPPVESGNISFSGLDYIANHKYRPSDYTHLDNLLNPVWTYLTELLPMWIAPNMVTTLGGLHCGVAYALLWYYSPDFDHSPPDWVVLFAAWCNVAYYTLDCMDGKQARRTGSSSPLGQLFDHGFDCICMLFFLANTGSYLMIGGSYWYMLLQTSNQLAFFMAQWEEYHTHILPHCTGKWIGVTEVNYSLGLISFVNSFLDREAFYTRPMTVVLEPLNKFYAIGDKLPSIVMEMELRHFLMSGYGVLMMIMMLLSIKRVMTHTNVAGDSLSPAEVSQRRMTALSKLATPLALCVAGFMVPPDAVRTRYLSVTLGLAFSLLTKKMIVFSMAKMAYAAVQWDAVPLLIVSAWIRFDGSLSKEGADFILGVLCFWYTYRMLKWVNVTINQICEKLGIYCFRLKKRKSE